MKLLALPILALLSLACGNTQAADTNDTPDLQTIIDTVSSHGDITKLLKFVKDYKMFKSSFLKLADVFPLMNSVLDAASSASPKLTVLMKVMEGKMPDIHDLYKLATDMNDNIHEDIKTLDQSVPQYLLFKKLVESPATISNLKDIDMLLQIMTGKKVQVKDSLLKRMMSKDFSVDPGDDIAMVNSMEFVFWMLKNIKDLKHIGQHISEQHAPSEILGELLTLDYSNLRKIVRKPEVVKEGKYQVGLRQPDQNVVQLMHDVTSGLSMKSTDSGSMVENLVIDIVKQIVSIGSTVFKSQ